VRTSESGRIVSYAAVQGLGPADLASAYALDTSIDPVSTIAIVDAYTYPNVESDLAQYRSQYGLPPCTTANGCLQIVNQNGQASPLPATAPRGDDWTVETALDLDMASAACPKCTLLLVEADDDVGEGLFIAQNAAANLGAAVISNSWGGPEGGGYPTADEETALNHPGVSIFVAAGDDGYNDGGQGADYPGTSGHVVGVGGTTLAQSASPRGWAESAWNLGGSGCSATIAKPAFQTDPSCANRASSDVAAVGDPNTGLAVYNAGAGGWIVVGGTSASAPLVAGIYALTGHGADGAAYSYANPGSYFDVSTGTNGSCTSALCRAGVGWDGPTGIGTPNGALLVPQTSQDPPTGGTGDGSGGGTGDGSGGGTGDGTGDGTGGGTGGGGASAGPGDVTGGCSAGGGAGAGGSMALVALCIGLALAPRRRRRC
jgi:subtilase family serine protease